VNVLDFRARKERGEKIVVTTCYDYPFARMLSQSDVDALLVGDSVAMVIHGHPSTIPATVDMMALHTAAVARGAGNKFIIADMPFLSFRKGVTSTLDAVDALMKAGAHAVKIEGIEGHEDAIRHTVQSGVPTMGHLGLTPQSVHQLGGYTVQGRDASAASLIMSQAMRLEDAGCFAIVLECVPSDVGRTVTERLSIPTIGIGAGPNTDGQVLVLHDLTGLSRDITPRFTRKFVDGFDVLRDAVNAFARAVRAGDFPSSEESFS
jgi:3-methyl-2-oxobutanoate hydroxymethyltransferase